MPGRISTNTPMVKSNSLAASLSLAVGVIERQFIARAVLLLRLHVDSGKPTTGDESLRGSLTSLETS